MPVPKFDPLAETVTVPGVTPVEFETASQPLPVTVDALAEKVRPFVVLFTCNVWLGGAEPLNAWLKVKLDGVVDAVDVEVTTTVIGTVTGELATVAFDGPVAVIVRLLVYVPTASPVVRNPTVTLLGVDPVVGPTVKKLLFGAVFTVNDNWLFGSVLVKAMS